MDLQVAIFLLIFLSISSLATIGICFAELRSCWRNYRSRHTTKQRNAAAAAALGVDDNEFAAACLAAAAAAEDAAIAPMTTVGAYGGAHGNNGYYYQDGLALGTGLSMSGSGVGQGPHNLPYPLLDPEAAGFDLLYDEYGGHLLLNEGQDDNGDGGNGVASPLLRDNSIIYGENIPMRGLVAPI